MTSEVDITQKPIRETADLIRPYVRHTPVIRVNLADFGGAEMPLDLKLECMQHTGSFKVRGAFANLLTRDVPAGGVVAASGGNHGAAVAYAARALGHPATIFVPEVTAPAKASRIRSYGADLVVAGQRYADALAHAQAFERDRGGLSVHAFDQPETLLGQGTLGVEIEADLPEVTTLLVAVGGGGLIGGITAWFRDRLKIVAVEPQTAPTLHRAFEAGEPVDAEAGGVAADSLAPKRVGGLMFAIAKQYLAPPVLVTDDDIRHAQRLLWDRLRIVTEPGGAAAFSAVLSGAYKPAPGERVAVLICGANTDAVKIG